MFLNIFDDKKSFSIELLNEKNTDALANSD